MYVYPVRKEVSLTIGTNSEEAAEAKRIFVVVVSALGLVPATAPAERALEGRARRYFIEDSIDENWLNKLADVVRSFVTTKASFRGDYWVGGQKFSKGKLEEWCSEVRSRWRDVLTLYCWCWLPHSSSTVEVDLLRQTLKLELQRPSPDVLREDFLRAETLLKLKPFEGNPYQYRKFARLFRIDDWKGDAALVESLKKAIHGAFTGRGPAVVNAYVTEGEKAEDLHSFKDLDSFISRLEEGTSYKFAQIYVEGPKGSSAGVRVDRSKERISVKSSLERDKFLKFLDDLQYRLDLTGIKIEDDQEKEDTKPDKKSSRELLIPILGVVLSALIGFGASLLTVGLPSLKTTLKITVPAISQDGIAHITGTSSPVRWTILSRTIRHGEIPLESTAKLTLERADGAVKKMEKSGARPGDTVEFPQPGLYYLTVHPEQISGAQDETIHLTVEPAEGKTQDRKTGN
jgi:hypothetical protein